MATTLDRILERTRETVRQRKAATDGAELERAALAHTPRGFAQALRRMSADGPAVIAELKKASPSRGIIREDFRPAELARALAGAGAATLSVLTDEPFFQGSLEYLREARAAVSLPLLRKDFTVDPFQIVEARANGADAILLIVAALTDAELRSLAETARDWHLDVLCEVHNAEELRRAVPLVELGVTMFGVNSRDLKTLQVHPHMHEELLLQMPAGVVRVAESGLRTADDVFRLREAGFDAFLIGESLMRQPDPAAELKRMLEPAGVGARG